MPRSSRNSAPDPAAAAPNGAGGSEPRSPVPANSGLQAADPPRPQPSAAAAAQEGASEAADRDAEHEVAAQLSFRQAQTALELCLAQLQAPDLDVEAMTGLYRRARRYADRCEQLLGEVEQEILLWDPQQPDEPPSPYTYTS